MDAKHTQTKRRAMFGFNASVAVAAAVSTVILVNRLVWWQYAATPPAVKKFIRYDLSATRAHSLSPQTKRVLAKLEGPHEIIAVFRDDAKNASELAAARRRNLEDLMEEYASASNLVAIRSVSAGAQGGAREVERKVAKRFAKEMRPLQESLTRAHAQLALLAGVLGECQAGLDQLANAAYPQERQQAQARATANTLARLRQKMLAQTEAAKKTLADPMPDYLRLRDDAYNLVVDASKDISECHGALSGNLANTASRLEDREVALDTADLLKKTEPFYRKAADILLQAAVPQTYEQARAALATGESLVVLTDTRARVVPADRLLRRVSDTLARAGGSAQDTGKEQFTGEEQITGALVSLGQSVPVRVVFLQSDAGLALTPDGGQPQGLFQAMANRLRAMDFEVDEANAWHPKAVDDNGNPLSLRAAKPGQRTVWVLCPFREPNPQQPATLKMDNRAKTCAFLQKQLDHGDSALILINHDPLPDPERVKIADQALGGNTPYAERHPINALLKHYGVEAQNWTVLCHEEQEPNMQPVPVVPVQIQHYPQDTELGRALEGLTLRLERPCPVVPMVPLPAGIRTRELVSIYLPRLYTLGYDALHDHGKQAYNPATARPYAPVALAVEAQVAGKPPIRLIAVGDPVWAADIKTTFGFHPELAPVASGGAVGMANTPGGICAWPGNAELFVNGIYWLAGQDDLIAPGAHSQDVRRIGPISQGTHTTLYWLLLAGLPAGAATAGLLVWARRRKF